jgi:large subunit ribosomal protein L18
LAVYRSLNNIFAQLIDDEAGKTIACASSLKMTGPLTKKAELVAKEIAGKAKELKLSALVYDRAGFRYHGAIKTVADIVRAEGVTI